MGTQTKNLGLWEKIVGTSPVSRTERPQQGVMVEEGVWDDRQLSISVQPDRLDIVLTAVPTPLPKLSDIGELRTALETFIQVLPPISFDEVTRVAFGAVLLYPVADHVEAYQTLAKLLPKVEIDPSSREFLYQINIPMPSRLVPDLEINTIRRWSAMAMHVFNLTNVGETDRVQLFATRLELDLNTQHDKALSDADVTRRIPNELIENALVIADGKNENA